MSYREELAVKTDRELQEELLTVTAGGVAVSTINTVLLGLGLIVVTIAAIAKK